MQVLNSPRDIRRLLKNGSPVDAANMCVTCLEARPSDDEAQELIHLLWQASMSVTSVCGDQQTHAYEQDGYHLTQWNAARLSERYMELDKEGLLKSLSEVLLSWYLSCAHSEEAVDRFLSRVDERHEALFLERKAQLVSEGWSTEEGAVREMRRSLDGAERVSSCMLEQYDRMLAMYPDSKALEEICGNLVRLLEKDLEGMIWEPDDDEGRAVMARRREVLAMSSGCADGLEARKSRIEMLRRVVG